MGGWLYEHENITNSVEVGAGAELGKIKVWIEGNIENKFSSAIWVDLKMFMSHNPDSMKGHFCP